MSGYRVQMQKGFCWRLSPLMVRCISVVIQKLVTYETVLQVSRLGAPVVAMLAHRKACATTSREPEGPPEGSLLPLPGRVDGA